MIRLRGPRYLFALFSGVLGPLGSLFAALRALLAALGCLLGALWPLLGLSWPPLGRSWALLGGSWEALGRSWGDLGATCKNHQKIDAKNDRFGVPKASQNGTKIGPQTDKKSMQKTKRKKNEIRPSWDRLGAILGCFVTALGVIFIDFSLDFKAFRENSLFSKNIVSRAVLDRS